MKKIVLKSVILMCCLAAFLAVMPGTVKAGEKIDVYEQGKLVKSVVFVVGKNEYFVNNQTPGIKMDAVPFIEQSRTFVPVRYLGNALGVNDNNIEWDGVKQKASLKRGEFSAELVIGKKQIIENGKARAIDVAPILKTGRTYLPARFVAEALGYTVEWDSKNGVVIAYPKGELKPDISNVIEYIGGKVEKVVQEKVVQEENQPGTHMVGGFAVPDDVPFYGGKTYYGIEGPDSETRTEIVIILDVLERNGVALEQQLEKARSILASKFGKENADMIIDYVSKKKDRFDDVPLKYFHIDGQTIKAGAPAGSYLINIVVWEPGVLSDI
ncbi:hypothetical protein JOC37_001335 [Desulfohalotomaculum tongense]|uniref:copper amine oxidase N-terminal domain-containing protein n=1 Tax=Desulforadius tongensis TaxID=1216062 RepID=UPI001EE501AB|nr:copper amine oxidase N-terminal domain-containing protein [Desulforadius tongensis]MBM7854955.1 hypothetical protein [Desulforadius tongensis]